MDIAKEKEEVKNKINLLAQELQMLDKVKNDKLTLLVKLQGQQELLEKFEKEVTGDK